MTQLDTTNITFRTAKGIDDFRLVRELLVETWGQYPPAQNWEIRRWDGTYFHNESPGFAARWKGGESLGLWFADSRLVAAAHPEGTGDAWLNVRPDFRWLEPAMLDWAEAGLARPDKEGCNRLVVMAHEDDLQRRELLAARGYVNTGKGEVFREKPYPTGEIEPIRMPAGYTLHTLRPGHEEDCARCAALLNAAFRRDFHTAAELMTFTQQSPSFRSELELVAVAPDGSFTALAGMIYDEVNCFGLFEPVCATPEPRPLGLTGALMHEGWRRVRELGALHCHVGTGIGMPANRFYEACGFRIIRTGWYWRKEM